MISSKSDLRDALNHQVRTVLRTSRPAEERWTVTVAITEFAELPDCDLAEVRIALTAGEHPADVARKLDVADMLSHVAEISGIQSRLAPRRFEAQLRIDPDAAAVVGSVRIIDLVPKTQPG